MDIMDIMKQRHSVRQYADKPIEQEKRSVLNALVAQCNARADLHIQILYDEPRCFDSLMAHYGKFTGVQNYIALVGKKSSTLDAQLGYYGEQLVLKAQELGLNTCWVALTHGKSSAQVAKGEKCVCLITLGYGTTQGIAHQSKPMADLSRGADQAPDWFRQGMEAAMLAPTAMNQQKFCFELCPDESVRLTCGKGFYTRLDMGIVKYHFEAASGKSVTG